MIHSNNELKEQTRLWDYRHGWFAAVAVGAILLVCLFLLSPRATQPDPGRKPPFENRERSWIGNASDDGDSWAIPAFVLRRSFDGDLWKEKYSYLGYPSVRLQMLDSLLQEHILTGKTRSQVVELLGEPVSGTKYLVQQKAYGDPAHGLLVIDYDPSDRVARIRLIVQSLEI